MKLLHPKAQSELAKKIFPCLALSESRNLARKVGDEKNLRTCQLNGSRLEVSILTMHPSRTHLSTNYEKPNQFSK